MKSKIIGEKRDVVRNQLKILSEKLSSVENYSSMKDNSGSGATRRVDVKYIFPINNSLNQYIGLNRTNLLIHCHQFYI